MADLQSIAAGIRLRCDDPLPQKPSLRRVLQASLDSTQHLYNRLENTGQAWSLKPDYLLQVSAQTSDFLLAIDESYGKPIQVITSYPTNPSHIPRYVEFREFQDMNFDWGLPLNIASWMYTDGSNCTAMRMAFYYLDDGSRYVRILPQPQLTAQYIITFANGDWASQAQMESSPVLSQFHPLVQIWGAQSVLPSCCWWIDEVMNIKHRQEVLIGLKNDEVRLGDEFDRYVRNLVDDHMTNRVSSFDGMNRWSW